MPDVSPATGTMSVRRMPGRIVEQHRKGVDRIHRGSCLGMNAISKSRNGTLQVGSTVEIVKSAMRNTGESRLSGDWMRLEDRWD